MNMLLEKYENDYIALGASNLTISELALRWEISLAIHN
ncbi:hypothetical protein GMES_3529 [Paraglaciecola mesophila KMM 241]|uniref:Uncharacterized protein n=1 Tax=Paraglaciecola mesophila KMM 241 TaxID=1128912 RepID=K6YPD0_9ALTE|nr:hypothetical protein GMES_3529 [Paraglaciecola mesophila KMM 241]